MSVFNRNKKKNMVPTLPPEHQASIEIVAHHTASNEVKKEAKNASKSINNLLERNNFTVSIVVGALGRPKPKKKHG